MAGRVCALALDDDAHHLVAQRGLWYHAPMNRSTITPSIDRRQAVLPAEPPPLLAGDRLSVAEFERRYHAHPEIKKAELIEGIVYMPSPVKHKQHGHPHLFLGTWVGTYLAATPGLDASDNATLRLDNANQPQPDLLLRLDRAHGGRSFIAADDYLVGAPELIVEVAASSANYDMHAKKHAYARNSVQEYLVALTYDRAVYWFALHEGDYIELQPDEQGILRSEVFPGLWLQPAALWANDLAGLLAVLQQGLASPEHAAFVQELSERQGVTQ
jgi:Uma2 family endonuclease